jgi:hypothetical protein
VRARPATRNAYGLLARPAAFDTVLYHDPASSNADDHGLHREHSSSPVFSLLTIITGYRAVRVRCIFRPPSVTRHVYPASEHLAYIEFFTPFSRSNNTPHGMYTTSTALHPDGRRQVAVVPISHLHMTCHIAPRFARVDHEIVLGPHSDLFLSARHFFFDHYMNHYVYKLFEHWRKQARRERP